jgi:hypothetical protein
MKISSRFVNVEEIKIIRVTIFVNPYNEPDEEEEKNREKKRRKFREIKF